MTPITSSLKIILTGNFGVGKTALFKRYLHNAFDQKYLTTIRAGIAHQKIEVAGKEVSILLWDLAGETRQEKVPRSYFQDAAAIVYVVDLTRPASWKNIEHDLTCLREVAPFADLKMAANKRDLIDKNQIEDTLAMLPQKPDITTSAKTGENVELLFRQLIDTNAAF